jgi:glycosyltransferase involved in cell wall biosynthesis
VHLAGPVSKKLVPGWLQRGDIFLNTSTVDNTPVSVMEAMACGLCVVSTNVGGLPAILEHRTHGLLTPADDAESMAASVRELIADPNLAAQVSLNGRRKMQEYDWSRILPLWQDILDNARTGTVHQSLEPVLSRIKDGLAG